MSDVIVLRHGQTYGNKAGVLNERPCGGLTELGKEQIRTVADRLQELRTVTALYTSYMWRARQSAGIVADTLGLQPTMLSGVHERHLGLFEGVNVSDALRVIDEGDLLPGKGGVRYLDGTYGTESFKATEARTGRALNQVRRRLRMGEAAVIVSHGDAALAMCAHAAGIPMHKMIERLHLSNGEFVRISKEGSIYHNDESIAVNA